MTDLRKAAEMALNALEFSLPAIEDFGSKEQLTDCHRAITALYKSLAQPEQEPVAWQVMVENEPMKEFSIKDMAHDWAVKEKRSGSQYSYWIRPLYAAPPKREWVGLTEGELIDIKDCNRGFWTNAAKIEQLLKDKNT